MSSEDSYFGHIIKKDKETNVYWCEECKTPIIVEDNNSNSYFCKKCNSELKYMSADLRPVFPEERLLLEILLDKPLCYLGKNVWAFRNRYFIDNEIISINKDLYKKKKPEKIQLELEKYKSLNNYDGFNENIKKFIDSNIERLNYIEDEAFNFIQETSRNIDEEHIVLSFSGGKDSTVTADLVKRALSNSSLVHIFGDTTLEFPATLEYAKRYRKENPYCIFKTAKNKEQNFLDVCEDIGPPARMMRWCCSMFKTGPITRVINSLYGSDQILTFYGIRKSESVSRSKYERISGENESIKIQQQTVASPIFFWRDIDIWLYLLGRDVDFNDAYRIGYDRVGCWCCPNNNDRAMFLSSVYMPENSRIWRDFLIKFAKSIGKPDAEIYIDTGKWKARQGGNGVKASSDVKIKYTNCTAEENAKIYKLNSKVNDDFISLFVPFGTIDRELGRKIINETIVLDLKTNTPIISIQPFNNDEYDYSVKIKTMNVIDHEALEKKIAYQIRKFNACRKCLKCESICKYGAIYMDVDKYVINEKKCKRCGKCITPKYLSGGCMMDKYLRTKEDYNDL